MADVSLDRRAVTLAGLQGNPRRMRTERLVRAVFLACAAASIVIIFSPTL